MLPIEIRLEGAGECVLRHGPSGAVIRTSKSPEYGGRGTSFSSTDLLAAALGSCIATDLEPVAERHGIAPGRIVVRAGKRLSVRPKRIESLTIDVTVAGELAEDVRLRLERAAQHCLVHRSLAPDVEVRVRVGVEGEEEGDG